MFAALPQPLEVEEVGRSFLGGLAGPALIAVAAVVAAFVAAFVSRRNHAEQLAADRELRDLDHARQSLSGAVETVSEAVAELSEQNLRAWKAHRAKQKDETLGAAADDFWPPHPRTVEQEEAIGLEAREEEARALEAANRATQEATEALNAVSEGQRVVWGILQRLAADDLRLRIALGDGSDVVESHKRLSQVFNEWCETLDPDEDGQFGFDGTTLTPPDVPVPGAMGDFIDACQRWAADRPVQRRQR